jgi:DNA-binding MarR family transcriptional regulator
MDNSALKKMLIDIPTKLCRTMSLTIVSGILTGFPEGFSKNHLTIVRQLDDNERMYITEIGDIIGITKPQMTATADKLIKMGFVKRIYEANDRRKIFLCLTPEGKSMAIKINQNIEVVMNQLLSDFSEEELSELAIGLNAFNKICSLCISRYIKRGNNEI